jgi:peptidoglycan/LPS O-acetylase OafA/YrhL
MVFFVLSGFVIAYCVDTKEKTLQNYLLNRFARLYSVVLPALCLTVILDLIGSNLDYKIYDGDWYQSGRPFLRFFSNLFFLNQIWFFNIQPFSNGPFWSLGYEFWYYMLFSAHIYLKKYLKWLCVAAISLSIGIKILLLYPVWLLGVFSYHFCKKNVLSIGIGWSLFLGSIMIYAFYRYYQMPLRFDWHTENILGRALYENLHGSKEFITSYIVAILISANFIGFIAISNSINKVFLVMEKPIRFCASYTFTLYLLHYPLLNFYAALLANDPTIIRDQVLLFALVLLSIYFIGNKTEHKKHQYKKIFEEITLILDHCRPNILKKP